MYAGQPSGMLSPSSPTTQLATDRVARRRVNREEKTMCPTHAPLFIDRRYVRSASQHFGHGAGRWLAAHERRRTAIVAAERTRIMKQASTSIASPPLRGTLWHTAGAVLTGVGLRLRARVDQPAGATPP
jgi:hypothetical protein